MAGSMKVNIKMIKSMDSEFIPGLMAGVMKDTGTKESNMESVLT